MSPEQPSRDTVGLRATGAEEAFWEALSRSAQVMIGVRTRTGPHVTPELFAVHGGRIWCATAASTLKARLLAGGGTVGVSAAGPLGSVSALGRAVVIDPVRPLQALSQPVEALLSPFGFGRFLWRNMAEMAGAALDLVSGRLGALPARRVLFGIEPEALAVSDPSGVLHSSGPWPATRRPLAAAPDADGDRDAARVAPDKLDRLPDEIAGAATKARASLGWLTPAGDVAVLPAAWQPGSNRAVVAAGLFELAGAERHSPASLSIEDWSGFGPSGKQGMMLRGAGTASPSGERVVVDLDVRRVTYWDGVRTGTVR